MNEIQKFVRMDKIGQEDVRFEKTEFCNTRMMRVGAKRLAAVGWCFSYS